MCYIFLPLDLDLNMNTTNRLMWVTCVGLSLIVSVSSRSVTLLFDPPTPKPGIITISCQFELAAGDTLNSLYFNKISDSRFFRYAVGSAPIIADKFKDKVLDYKTDNATYMDLTFALSACDVAQYECNVLPSPSNVDITDQKNLDVINDIPPKLKINGELLPNGTVYVGVGVVVVTCELRNAGPPLPETLYLLQDGAAVATNSSFVQNTTTCTWDLPVLTLDVNVSAEDFPKNGRLYHCDVYYRALRNESSNIVRIVVNETVVEDPCSSNPCQNGGTCNSTIEGDTATYSCECPCGFIDVNCSTHVCDSKTCLNYGTCSVDTDCAAKCDCPDGVDGDTCDNANCLGHNCSVNSTCWPFPGDDNATYQCNCTGDNIYGALCDQTGCGLGVCSCENGASCVDTAHVCSCDCVPGCSGANCTIFDEGDLCSLCENAGSCVQGCGSYNCTCQEGFSGPFCNETCTLEVTDTTTEPEVFYRNLTETVSLRCDAVNVTSVLWKPFNVTGSDLTFNATEVGTFNVTCRIETPSCVDSLNYTIVVEPFSVELSDNGNEVCVGQGQCQALPLGGEVEQTIGPGGDLNLKAAIAVKEPLPTLLIAMENEAPISKRDVSKIRTILNESDTGSVSYYGNDLNASDSGSYIALARLLGYEEVIYTVVISVSAEGENGGGDEDGGCTVVIIIVIVVCSLGCCCIVVIVVCCVMKKKKKERRIGVAAVCCCVMKKKKQEQNCNHGNGGPLGPKAGGDNPVYQNYNGYEPQDEKTMPASQQPASIQRENSDSESSRKFKNRVTPDKEDLTLTERHHHPPSQDFRDEPEMSPSPKRKKKKKSRKHRNDPEGEVGRADIDHPHRPLPVPAHKKLPPLKKSDPRAGNYHNNAYEWRDEEGEC